MYHTMNMNIKYCFLLTILTLFVLVPVFSEPLFPDDEVPSQTDTLIVPAIQEVPEIDGRSDDQCWSATEWQGINHTWVPWGGSVDSADYFGRYKCVWSPVSNLLYFLLEITDDVFVDGYVYNPVPGSNNNYPDYDIVEVFIDEDRSGGINIFDAHSEELGYNAENAFSYHIAANAPVDGGITTEKIACDIAGTDWSDYFIPDYNAHLPEFALYKNDRHYTWEFSMRVYDDSFDPDDPDASLLVLHPGKIMGLSLAYCDNDTPGTKRDNFFGTVHVKESRYNEHWKDATDFGVIKLSGENL